MFPDEEIIQSFTFFRDSIVLTTLGIYVIAVQGLTDKKVEVKSSIEIIKTISWNCLISDRCRYKNKCRPQNSYSC